MFFNINESALKVYVRNETNVELNQTAINLTSTLNTYDKVFVSMYTSTSNPTATFVTLPTASSSYHKKEIIITSMTPQRSSYPRVFSNSTDMFIDGAVVFSYIFKDYETIRIICQKYPIGSTTYFWAIR